MALHPTAIIEPGARLAANVSVGAYSLIAAQVEIDLAALARHPARVLQHAHDNAVSALAVLDDLFQIAGQRRLDVFDIGPPIFVQLPPGSSPEPGRRTLTGTMARITVLERTGSPRVCSRCWDTVVCRFAFAG